jgi:solute carrier family 50 protein (sugar transporter)
MFAAPIADLRHALFQQSLGDLNPRPWAVMTGNCLGWCAYAYYIHDPFILASNVPGFVLSIWLNTGAAKLQYKAMTTAFAIPVHSRIRARNGGGGEIRSGPSLGHRPVPLLHVPNDPEENDDVDVDIDDNGHDISRSQYYNAAQQACSKNIVFTPQEVWWLTVLMIWSLALVWVGWISPFLGYQAYQATTVGLLVNANLIFFYGVPLQTMQQVIASGHSNSIHPPSMFLAIGNATFWLLYGVALWDYVLMVPNSIGLTLGLAQVLLCLVYPKKPRRAGASTAVLDGITTDEDDPDAISMTKLPSSSSSSPSLSSPNHGLFRDLHLSTNLHPSSGDDYNCDGNQQEMSR